MLVRIRYKKKLKHKLEEGLDLSFDRIDMQTYSAFITKSIQEKVDSNIYEGMFKGIDDHLKSITGKLKPEYKLSELVELFKESVDEYDKEDLENCFFECEYDCEHGWYTVYLDHDPDANNRNSEVEFMITKSGSVFILRTITTWGEKQEKNNPIKMGDFTDFQMLLFKLKMSSNCNVIIDEDYVDVYYSHSNDY